MNPKSTSTVLSPRQFDQYVGAEADGEATPEQLAVLEADRPAWRGSLLRLLREAEDHLATARSLPGEERNQVVADLTSERRQLSAAWARLTAADGVGPDDHRDRGAHEDRDESHLAPSAQLQVSWEPGWVVAWAAGPRISPVDSDAVIAMLTAAGAPASAWNPHAAIRMPHGSSADAFAAPVGEVLGWLVAAGADQAGDRIGPSVRWLGRVAIWAVELTARGAMVPLLRQRRRGRGGASDSIGAYSVRWTPALIDPVRLAGLARTMPGTVLALDPSVSDRALIRSALTGMVDAICRDSARRLEVPAPPPRVRTAADIGEAFLGRLDGSAFDAPLRLGGEISARIERWARSVTRERAPLIVRLDPPDEGDAWSLRVLAPGPEGGLTPIEQAIVNGGSAQGSIEDDIARLERMLPALRRPGGTRHGQVILSQDEAWELMVDTGPQLAAAGFDVRVPALSRRRPTPALRVFADEASESAVGATQLANVRWSALFDDVELTAADIARLAKDARPLIRSGGRWVAIHKADLNAAAVALAERATTTQLSGADMLRLALGLEGSPLPGGTTVSGGGWAATLLTSAANLSAESVGPPAGFVGDLRDYQAEALAWLGFLDSAELGGCLALDMGLGKTPTMLAHLLADTSADPALVVAPAAVVGNWAAEAARFAPGLRVVVHHGTNRASAEEIAAEVAEADVVITTYGTAVRDVDAIADVSWSRVVLDEAQTIKNPASDTSQQLRRIPTRSRIALTGTPIENGLGDLWAILDFTNPGLVGPRPQFIAQLSRERGAAPAAEEALRALNGILVFRRTKAEPMIAAELPEQIDELDHCAMTPEQIGLYQAVLDKLVLGTDLTDGEKPRKGQILAAITALKQICNHPSAYQDDDRPLDGRSGKLARLDEIVAAVFAAEERVLVFTHFAEWGMRLAEHLTDRTGTPVACYHGGLSRTVRDRLVEDFQSGDGPGALVLSLKAGGTGLNLTAASHVVLFDRWWNPAVEDQARDRAWRIGQTRTVICHRLICPGTVDERVEEVVAGKRLIADLVLPKSSSIGDLDSEQLRVALGIRPDAVLTEDLLVTDGGTA